MNNDWHEAPFDTEKPPAVREGLGDPNEKRRVLQLDFSENLDALPAFARWLRSGDAWAAFGEWYDWSGPHFDEEVPGAQLP